MAKYIRNLKSILNQNFINMLGWRTTRKIIVIESDDWGSIRMPSSEVYSKFVDKGLNLVGTDYNRIDTLECNEDLYLLLEVLHSFKGLQGKTPVITANIVVGNPDFGKIKDSDFRSYHYEPVTKTLLKYPNRDRVESLWKKGDSEGIFHPQFHGREHVNTVRWMEALRKRTPAIMFTFDNETTFSGNGDYNFMEVLDFNTPDDLPQMIESLDQGLDLFENIFGYKSKSYIPPCYVWDSEIEKIIYKKGVRYIQGLVIQSLPRGSFGNYNKKYNVLGRRNSLGMLYLVRNCFFEPAFTELSDPVGECLRRIDIAFKWHKPAIICSHRINYMGSLDAQNRTTNLMLLRDLLSNIINTWPDVEFMTSDQLGDLIKADKIKI